MSVIPNKWLEKSWRDPHQFRVTIQDKKSYEEDSTPLLKKNNAPDLLIKWNRANRTKTLRGLRKA